jgi:hypothetical protein
VECERAQAAPTLSVLRHRTNMSIEARIKQLVTTTPCPVVLRSELRGIGSSSRLSVALNALLEQGVLVRIGTGVYAKAKPSVLTGKPIPIEPLEVLAPLALEKLGVKVLEPKRSRDYNAGRTTQVPTGLVVNVGSRRVTRKLGFAGKFIRYERE